ncbi:uncharacterized protein L969DRAFT_294229 [Mixia osmundae IAM 14324]|uniref:Integral membrane protein n=1 Tax=Mixia osmundae (strain CBS 9802 / IAM 14324 / JCM 22182 / KY 12970) TaxID=764103 RepID=G7DXE8_MIXOS|nr:uncharacterized protein L969DRAFT_294229 [Mixia osmundae IAM 14324]KEI41248.1 hypothetical protein L969DRAFT_294229 [Mixia osmundae IAM 14324]GAA95258.1 hypothetical protein E5Q_01914 [Mixia osmundae IAM 14324]
MASQTSTGTLNASTTDPSIFQGAPDGYVIPRWPALYDPSKPGVYLYYPYTIWRFTVYWTLLLSGTVFLVSGITAFLFIGRGKSGRQLMAVIAIPVAFVLFGMITMFVSATIVGFALAALYTAGFLRMSTWVPFLWALTQILVVTISSYSTLPTIM